MQSYTKYKDFSFTIKFLHGSLKSVFQQKYRWSLTFDVVYIIIRSRDDWVNKPLALYPGVPG